VLESKVSLREAISLKLERHKCFTFNGKPSSRYISTFGQSTIPSRVRDGNRTCMSFSNNFKFSAPTNDADDPSLRNDSN